MSRTNEMSKHMKSAFAESKPAKAYKSGGSVKADCYAMGGPGKMRKGEMSKSGKPTGCK